MPRGRPPKNGTPPKKGGTPVPKVIEKTEVKEEREEKHKLCCPKCGCTKQTNFYQTRDKSRAIFGKVLYCKDCVKEMYTVYLRKYRSMNLALYYTCRKADIPYIHPAYLGAVENVNNTNSKIQGEDAIISAYMKNLSFSESNGWGTCFDDSIGEDQVEGLASFDVYTKVRKARRITGTIDDKDLYDTVEYDTEYLQNKWGIYNNEELAYLESEYLDWQEKLGVTLIETIRRIRRSAYRAICM
jgi:hypothetical protein